MSVLLRAVGRLSASTLLLAALFLAPGSARAAEPSVTSTAPSAGPSAAPSTAPSPPDPPGLADPIVHIKIKIPEAPDTNPKPHAPAENEGDYTTRRYEPAGFPLIGGNSDIGFQFGGVATLSHFADGIRPYAWNMDFVASASLKDGPTGLQLAQESFLYNADLPGYLNGKLRVNFQAQYQRTINQGYYGLGNAASGTVPANFTGPSGRYFEWIDSVANPFIQPRYKISGPWDLTAAIGYRFMSPRAYADSKLARDAETRDADGSPVVRGLQTLSITQLAFGTVYDSRDEEIFPHHGAYGQIGVAYQQAFPTSADVQYGETQGLLQIYRPVGPFVLAMRGVADFQFGNVPFYDLAASGPFGQSEAIGGGSGVRGVPVGRYAGEIKLYGTVELRSMFLHFHLFKHKVSLGADALFDTGRSWLDYTFRSPLDGTGVGLKYGVGGGIYVLWGQAAIFRIDAAYSPDAAAENPSFPIGFYVADGVMF